MKKEQAKIQILQAGADAGLDQPISQVSLPQSEDLVSELFLKEDMSRMQIKDMTANGGMSYLEIQHILATKTFLSDEDRKAFQESVQNTRNDQPEVRHETANFSGHKSPFEELIGKIASLLASMFGLEGDHKSDSWLRSHLFKK